MRGRLLLLFVVLISYLTPVFSQSTGSEIIAGIAAAVPVIRGYLIQGDSIRRPAISLSREQAIQLLQKKYRLQPVKSSQDHVIMPYDTISKSETDLYSGKRDSVSFFKYSSRNDSIKAAVGVLLDYLEARDSSIISIFRY